MLRYILLLIVPSINYVLEKQSFLLLKRVMNLVMYNGTDLLDISMGVFRKDGISFLIAVVDVTVFELKYISIVIK